MWEKVESAAAAETALAMLAVGERVAAAAVLLGRGMAEGKDSAKWASAKDHVGGGLTASPVKVSAMKVAAARAAVIVV